MYFGRRFSKWRLILLKYSDVVCTSFVNQIAFDGRWHSYGGTVWYGSGTMYLPIIPTITTSLAGRKLSSFNPISCGNRMQSKTRKRLEGAQKIFAACVHSTAQQPLATLTVP